MAIGIQSVFIDYYTEHCHWEYVMVHTLHVFLIDLWLLYCHNKFGPTQAILVPEVCNKWTSAILILSGYLGYGFGLRVRV